MKTKIQKIMLLVVLLSTIFCMGGCVPNGLSEKEVSIYEETYIPIARAWFAKNKPNATDVTYNYDTKSTNYYGKDAATDFVYGTYKENEEEFDYLLDCNKEVLYVSDREWFDAFVNEYKGKFDDCYNPEFSIMIYETIPTTETVPKFSLFSSKTKTETKDSFGKFELSLDNKPFVYIENSVPKEKRLDWIENKIEIESNDVRLEEVTIEPILTYTLHSNGNVSLVDVMQTIMKIENDSNRIGVHLTILNNENDVVFEYETSSKYSFFEPNVFQKNRFLEVYSEVSDGLPTYIVPEDRGISINYYDSNGKKYYGSKDADDEKFAFKEKYRKRVRQRNGSYKSKNAERTVEIVTKERFLTIE